jgi:DNA-binding CsgD family transcriptional regulator/predicted nucleic acid-binding Zn ribbon protein
MSNRRPSAREAALELKADLLLRSVRADRSHPLTMRQLDRKKVREVEWVPEDMEPPAGQDVLEDLRFIGAASPLTEKQKCVYYLWLEGRTFEEMARAVGISSATAYRTLRAALMRCLLLGPVPFGAFSRQCVYRPPQRHGLRSGRRCVICAAPLWDAEESATCGAEACKQILRHQRALDRKLRAWR